MRRLSDIQLNPKMDSVANCVTCADRGACVPLGTHDWLEPQVAQRARPPGVRRLEADGCCLGEPGARPRVAVLSLEIHLAILGH